MDEHNERCILEVSNKAKVTCSVKGGDYVIFIVCDSDHGAPQDGGFDDFDDDDGGGGFDSWQTSGAGKPPWSHM